MLHMYKNMHYIYINMYTMCKTYGIQTTRGNGMGGGDREEPRSHEGGCKTTDQGEVQLHRKKYNVYMMIKMAQVNEDKRQI